jgi:hypothetical protein
MKAEYIIEDAISCHRARAMAYVVEPSVYCLHIAGAARFSTKREAAIARRQYVEACGFSKPLSNMIRVIKTTN